MNYKHLYALRWDRVGTKFGLVLADERTEGFEDHTSLLFGFPDGNGASEVLLPFDKYDGDQEIWEQYDASFTMKTRHLTGSIAEVRLTLDVIDESTDSDYVGNISSLIGTRFRQAVLSDISRWDSLLRDEKILPTGYTCANLPTLLIRRYLPFRMRSSKPNRLLAFD